MFRMYFEKECDSDIRVLLAASEEDQTDQKDKQDKQDKRKTKAAKQPSSNNKVAKLVATTVSADIRLHFVGRLSLVRTATSIRCARTLGTEFFVDGADATNSDTL
eukprot:2693665-Heterocapsa_arctica.AAC.1